MSEAEKYKLVPCPFCGSKNVDPEGWATLPEYAKTPEKRSGPACDDCGATAQSIVQWNTRAIAALPPQPVMTEEEREFVDLHRGRGVHIDMQTMVEIIDRLSAQPGNHQSSTVARDAAVEREIDDIIAACRRENNKPFSGFAGSAIDALEELRKRIRAMKGAPTSGESS